nr:unnamed protein product [Callosobruchus analis]
MKIPRGNAQLTNSNALQVFFETALTYYIRQKKFKCLHFQDDRMKNCRNAYPQIIFIDGTYCLVDLHLATYHVIEDGNGLSEIVTVSLVAEENKEFLTFFVESFKNKYPAWKKGDVVMSDTDRTERSVFQRVFLMFMIMKIPIILNLFSNLTKNDGCETEAGSVLTKENSELHVDDINECVVQNESVTE